MLACGLIYQTVSEGRLAKATWESRAPVLRAFGRTLPSDLLLEDVTGEHADRFYSGSHRRRASQKSYFHLLKIWLGWCVKNGLLEKNPMASAAPPRAAKASSGLPAYFQPHELRRLLHTIEADAALKQTTLHGAARSHYLSDLPALARLAVETGLRRGELLHLRWCDVDLVRSLIHVAAYTDQALGFSFSPKDVDSRTVPMSPVCRALLAELSQTRANEDDTALVFPGRTGKPRDGRRLSRTFRAYRERAGLPSRLHFHSLRHTFASWLASSGVPIIHIQKWIGHSDLRMTMRYAALLPSETQWPGSKYHEMIDEVGGGVYTAERG